MPRPGARLFRGVGDTLAVLRRADPASALRWCGLLAVRAPQVARSGSLRAADAAWRKHGASFRTPGGRRVVLPGPQSAGAREMYCRDVYLRTGLRIPAGGWVVDLGANAGLFTVLAAVEGARVVAVEAQRGFVPSIDRLLRENQVDPHRVHVEVALIAADTAAVALVGVVADDRRWRTASHATAERPAPVSMPELLSRHAIDRVALLKVDIEGSEFSLLHPDNDLGWLARVDQITMEVHPEFGDVRGLGSLLRHHGFAVQSTDNDGRTVPDGPDAAYLYARRSAPRVDAA